MLTVICKFIKDMETVILTKIIYFYEFNKEYCFILNIILYDKNERKNKLWRLLYHLFLDFIYISQWNDLNTNWNIMI